MQRSGSGLPRIGYRGDDRPVPPKLETVLFDVDGTLLDTREFIFQAFEHACAEHGLAVPRREQLTPLIGQRLDAIYVRLGATDPAACCETHRTFQERHLDLAAPFPGVHEALGRLREAGLTLAAVTTRSRRTSLLTLELAGIGQTFATVVSAEDAPAVKPDPAPLRLALQRAGRTAEGAAMVGDTPADVLAGRALSLYTVAVTYGFHGLEVAAAHPDALAHTVADIPPALGVQGR